MGVYLSSFLSCTCRKSCLYMYHIMSSLNNFIIHLLFYIFHYLLSIPLLHEQVSATFAASLVISPALGTWLTSFAGGQNQVIILASIITVFNLLFIIYVVPESLAETSRKTSWGSPISWKQADPFTVRQEGCGCGCGFDYALFNY